MSNKTTILPISPTSRATVRQFRFTEDGRRVFSEPIPPPRRFRQAAASALLHFGYAIAALVAVLALGIVATAGWSWLFGGIASGRVW